MIHYDNIIILLLYHNYSIQKQKPVSLMALHIKNVLQAYTQTDKGWKYQLLNKWSSIFGDINTKITLEKINNDTVILGVYDSCWMQELYYLSPLLINKINESLDTPRIKNVRFKKVGKQKTNIVLKKEHIPTTKKIVPISLTEKRALNKIGDPELSKVLEAFRIRCYQEKE